MTWTPAQKIKQLIVWEHYEPIEKKGLDENVKSAVSFTVEEIEAAYDALMDEGDWDAKNQIREGMFETDIPAPSSRNYESRSVAMETPDGTWVGWTYWYGGGKHSNPEEIEWIDDAYDVHVTEETKMVIVRTWEKI